MTLEHPGAAPSVEPPKKRLSPWIFVGAITLLALVIVLLVFSLMDDDAGEAPQLVSPRDAPPPTVDADVPENGR